MPNKVKLSQRPEWWAAWTVFAILAFVRALAAGRSQWWLFGYAVLVSFYTFELVKTWRESARRERLADRIMVGR